MTSRRRGAKSLYTERVNRYLRSNQVMWDIWARHHLTAPSYAVDEFKKTGARAHRPDGMWQFPPGLVDVPLMFSPTASRPRSAGP